MLNLLWAVIAVGMIMARGISKRRKIMNAFAGSDMLPMIAPEFSVGRKKVQALLVFAGAAFAVIALAGPLIGYRWEKVTRKGVDIMIALDCSKSMLAQDIRPTRLERAKREIIDLMHMMKSDRAGLVAFSGKAVLQCPLTLDHEAFNIFLNALRPGCLPVGGTNLEDAVRTCYSGFEKDADTEKAIIIITDGEATAGNVMQAAEQMAKKSIKIFCIGVGSRQGAPIPDKNSGFKKDSSGNIIMARIDEKTLEKIAGVTGGAYVRSVAGDMDLDVIYKDRIQKGMKHKKLVSGREKIWENMFQWFLFPGVLVLGVECFLFLRRKSGSGLTVLFFVCFILGSLSVFPGPCMAKNVFSSVKKGIDQFRARHYEQAEKHFIDAQLEDPDNVKLYYDIGTASYMNREYKRARQNFMQAARSKDKKLSHDARYNLANTQYRLGNLDEAIKEYESVLKDFPDDREAKENLEFVKQRKKELEKKQSGNSGRKNRPDNDRQVRKQTMNSNDADPGQHKKKQQNTAGQKTLDTRNTRPGRNQGRLDRGNSMKNRNQAQAQSLAKLRQNMLNRLKDRPGRAMMSGVQKQFVEKDW